MKTFIIHDTEGPGDVKMDASSAASAAMHYAEMVYREDKFDSLELVISDNEYDYHVTIDVELEPSFDGYVTKKVKRG